MIFPINLPDRLPLLLDDPHRILVGTGMQVSMHQPSPLRFMGRLFNTRLNLPQQITPQSLSDIIGTPVTSLMGMDIISQFRVYFSYHAQTIDFDNEDGGMPGIQVPVDHFHGIPIVEVEINGKPRRMIVNSGTKISYLKSEFTAGIVPIENVKDFYSVDTPFTTPIFPIETRLIGHIFPVRYGNPPVEVSQVLTQARVDGILGSDLFYAFDLGLDMRTSRLYCQPV